MCDYDKLLLRRKSLDIPNVYIEPIFSYCLFSLINLKRLKLKNIVDHLFEPLANLRNLEIINN